jgi:alkylation response protein AidB-like acyl-CoA dehydrogenase
VTAVVHDHRPERRGTASAHDERFRAELRRWLAEHAPPAIETATTPEEADAMRAWQRLLHLDCWVGIHWPVEHGGRGASPAQTAIYNEELARAGAPPLLGRVGISLVGPTLIPHGTEEQRRQWMPRILNGDDVWCQLFSEPDAGSDLAGLTTRAEKHDDVYVVNGQKVWSSYARFANWGIALVRTDQNARNHHGISMLAIPMTAAGVDVRPLRQITGEHEFNEVFFDNVEIPADYLIGPEHDGWRVANTTLANERGASFIWREQVLHEVALEHLTAACATLGRIADPIVRQRLARSWIEVEIFRLHNARTLTRLARGEGLGAESSLVKLFWANMSQRLHDTALAALGPGALLMADDGGAIDDGEWSLGVLACRANSIMGGTSEIQRNIIGERLLGLPREAR